MPQLDFSSSPVLSECFLDKSFVRVLWGPVGCLAGETLVLTEAGPQRIDALARPARVLSYDAKEDQFRFVLASASFPKGRDALYRVRGPRGEWRAAAHHLVLCADGTYRRVDSLEAGQSIRQCFGGLTLTSGYGAIRSVAQEDKAETYWDLQVPGTNNYVTVDGAIHHNSGKSTLCCGAIMANAMVQPAVNGIRSSRYIVVRNTQPELKSTTIASTWLRIFPERFCGPITYSAPITHRIKVPPVLRSREGDVPGLDCEVVFLAIDQEADVDKLRSYDTTGAWINEGALVPLAAAQMMIRRIGRFPAKAGDVEAVEPFLIIDSNATDEDNELRQLEAQAPDGWKFFHQPPAVLEVQMLGGKAVCVDPDPRYTGMTFPHSAVIKAAGRAWVVNPQAENLAHLRKEYYPAQLPGSTLEQIQRDLQVRFVYVQDGRPVVPEFSQLVHVVDELPLLEGVSLEMGGDIGGGTLNPAAVIGQRHETGTLLIHDELICSDVGLKDYCLALKAKLAEPHLQRPGVKVGRFHGDPAGNKRDELFGDVIFEHLRAEGLDAHPVHTNDIELRLQAIRSPFTRMVRGKPAILIHRRCKTLIQALAGKWKYRKIQVSGGDRYSDKPEKSHPYSDAGDALGYLIMGGGEVRVLQGRKTGSAFQPGRTVQARVDFDIFGGNN